MTTHGAPIRGDKFTAVTTCCGRRVIEIPDSEPLVPDGDTPSCGIPAVEPDQRAA